MTNATIKTSRKRPFNWVVFQRQAAPYIFISPFFILFLVFTLFGLVFSLYLSFQDWDIASGLSTMKPYGIRNFTFTWEDPDFWKALRNTFYIAVISGVPQHLIAIPAAYVMHTLVKRMRHFFSAALFVPFITSVVAISLIVGVLFSERNGIINQTLLSMHEWPLVGGLFPDQDHLVNWKYNQYSLPILISFVVVWKYTGYNILFYMAGLQTISPELYEAAEVDGATKWHQFWYITLPLLRPIAFYSVTLTLIGNLNLFDVPYVLSNPLYGQNQAGMTMAAYLYKTAFTGGFAGQSAAASWMFTVVVVALTVINNRIFSGGREK
jgi:multiple sugar transport system permease protein